MRLSTYRPAVRGKFAFVAFAPFGCVQSIVRNRHNYPTCVQAAEEKASETTKAEQEETNTWLKSQHNHLLRRMQCFPA